MLSVALSVVITVFAVGMVVFAAPWADPTATPPGNNAAEPINVSDNGQAKSGGLLLNTGGASVGLIVQNGSMGIGDTTPDADLKLDVEGKVGATEYCDQNGENCKAMAAGGGGSINYSDCYEVAAFSSPAPDHTTISRIQCTTDYVMVGLGTYHYPYNYADMANIKCCKLQ